MKRPSLRPKPADQANADLFGAQDQDIVLEAQRLAND
jgi:hypothetical protein